MSPKAFISYSWTSQEFRDQVREWAERLAADGIEVVIDVFDLKDGHDKYAFMERMVTDPTVTHVLVMCNRSYTEKADARKAGVGTESQIISTEIYEKVEQSKFIPIITEVGPDGKPFLPAFLASRIWIDFSSAEAANDNWERLIRTLYGRPLFEKPRLGSPPAYIQDAANPPSSEMSAKFAALRGAILAPRPGVGLYRDAFVAACVSAADEVRIRSQPDEAEWPQRVLADCARLVSVRNHLIDWVVLESEVAPSAGFDDALLGLLEALVELKARPAELSSWRETWFEALRLFTYETFLYVVAALLKTRSYQTLRQIYSHQYLRPATERELSNPFVTFQTFHATSSSLQEVLAPPERRLLSPAAELVKRQAGRGDLTFHAVQEAELLSMMMALIDPTGWWYPGTLLYSRNGIPFTFFLRASQRKHFLAIATITGLGTAAEVRDAVLAGLAQGNVVHSGDFQSGFHRSFRELMNLDKLDTLP